MKISHKLCVRMDGTQFLWLWWFTTKNHSPQTFQPAVYVLLLSLVPVIILSFYFGSKKQIFSQNQIYSKKMAAFVHRGKAILKSTICCCNLKMKVQKRTVLKFLKLNYCKKVFFSSSFICQRRFSNDKVGNRKN